MGAIVQLNSAATTPKTGNSELALTLTQTSKYISHAFRNKKHEYYL
jgi:hypothetical protein